MNLTFKQRFEWTFQWRLFSSIFIPHWRQHETCQRKSFWGRLFNSKRSYNLIGPRTFIQILKQEVQYVCVQSTRRIIIERLSLLFFFLLFSLPLLIKVHNSPSNNKALTVCLSWVQLKSWLQAPSSSEWQNPTWTLCIAYYYLLRTTPSFDRDLPWRCKCGEGGCIWYVCICHTHCS